MNERQRYVYKFFGLAGLTGSSGFQKASLMADMIYDLNSSVPLYEE